MPKPSQNIATTEGSKRIDINYLFRNGFIKKESGQSGQSGQTVNLSWLDCFGLSTGNIFIKTKYTENEKSVIMFYTNTDFYTGKKSNIKQKIEIVEIPSNLGKGFNYYFLCPFSNRRCKILYKAYGSPYFRSRYAYNKHIYYSCQKCSKKKYNLTRYFKFEDRLEKYLKLNIRKTYKGKKTRSYKKYEYLKKQVEIYDNLRWKAFQSYLVKKGMLN